MDFPAKILLFGEYGLLVDSIGLAIPYPHFSGRFNFFAESDKSPEGKESTSNSELLKLLDYLKREASGISFLDLYSFEADLNRGLYFDSTIPPGSGLGSSGALSAAIYARYSTDRGHNDYQKIRTCLATIESSFHGLSSGIDPVISLINKPILINKLPTAITEVDLSPFLKSYTLFLINTHVQGKTKDLVASFLQRYGESDFKYVIDNEYLPLINQTIGTILSSDFGSFEATIAKYSHFQLSYFTHLIPVGMRKYFEHGIASAEFHLKICGSGGGGFILGFARDRMKAETYLKENHLDYLIV
jgi:mevalonate kinase